MRLAVSIIHDPSLSPCALGAAWGGALTPSLLPGNREPVYWVCYRAVLHASVLGLAVGLHGGLSS